MSVALKPHETEVLLKKDFQTVEELQDLLDQAMKLTNQHPSTIYVETTNLGDFSDTVNGPWFVLEAEALSDGSIVYNITID